MSSLYNIADRQYNLLALLESGEVEEEVLTTALAEVEHELVAKAADYIAVIQSMDNHVELVKKELDRLKAYKKSLDNNQARMKQALVEAMQKTNHESISTGRGALKLRWNPESVTIDDGAVIPSEFTKTKIEVTPDKTAIKTALKAGQAVPGCHLEKVQRVEVK